MTGVLSQDVQDGLVPRAKGRAAAMTAAKEVEEVQATPLVNAQRTFEFWRRASGVYVSYKGAQVSICVSREPTLCWCALQPDILVRTALIVTGEGPRAADARLGRRAPEGGALAAAP